MSGRTTRVSTHAEVRRKVSLTVAMSEYFLRRPIRTSLALLAAGVALDVVVPAVDPVRAREITVASGCRTAKVKVAAKKVSRSRPQWGLVTISNTGRNQNDERQKNGFWHQEMARGG